MNHEWNESRGNVCQQSGEITKSSMRSLKTAETVQWFSSKRVTTAASTGLAWHYKLEKNSDDDMNTWHAIKNKKKHSKCCPFLLIFVILVYSAGCFPARVEILIRGPPFEVFLSHALGIISDSSTCGKYRQFQWFYQRSLDPLLATHNAWLTCFITCMLAEVLRNRCQILGAELLPLWNRLLNQV